jgi:hypothetical protein
VRGEKGGGRGEGGKESYEGGVKKGYRVSEGKDEEERGELDKYCRRS